MRLPASTRPSYLPGGSSRAPTIPTTTTLIARPELRREPPTPLRREPSTLLRQRMATVAPYPPQQQCTTPTHIRLPHTRTLSQPPPLPHTHTYPPDTARWDSHAAREHPESNQGSF